MALSLFSFSFAALGSTANEFQIYHHSKEAAEEAAAEAIEHILEIESKYSRYKDESIVSRINRAAGKDAVEVDAETAYLIDYADVCFKESAGLFDITSGILRRAWDFKSKVPPSDEKVAALLPLIGWDKAVWNKPYFSLTKEGMEIDFGGLGKEYAVDKAAGVLKSRGIRSALINLAGDIRVIGALPDGSPWKIGVKNPSNPEKVISTIFLKQGAVATSGDYERYIDFEGKRYFHILNPKSGWPVFGFKSITVVAESCLVAGTVSTIAVLKGKKDGIEFLKEIRKEYVAVDTDMEIYNSRP